MGFAVLGRNDDLAVTTLELAHSDLAIDLRYDCWVRGVAGLEELGNSWETTGDVTSTSYGTWNLNESGTGRYLLSVFYHYVTAYGEVVGTEHIAVGVEHIAGRNLGVVLGVDDNLLGKTCGIVGLGLEGDTVDDVVEAQCTGIFGNDERIEGVPLGDEVALLDDVAVLVVEDRTVGQVEGREDDIGIGVDESDLTQTAYDHTAILGLVVAEGNVAHLFKLNAGVVLGNDAGVGGCITSHTTGVECTQCKLCTRLTDGLSGNDTGSFAQLYHTRGGEVAAIALGTDTALALTGKYGADLYHLDG